MFDDYTQFDGLDLAALIAGGEVSAVEVLEAAIARAEAVNPSINAIVTDFHDHARERARQDLSGPFAGVPFLLKDVHHALSGTPMSNGSRLHVGEVSTFDAEIVQRFLAAGVVVFGKTNTPEYKLSSHTVCEAWGSTRNPWDVARSTYGSSGGSAAAVAAGIVPVASGTDEGGSIRLPASACGVFGLKPSRGRNPIGPDFGWEHGGQSTSHVLSRTVRDCAAMLDATAGPEPGSPYTAPGEGGFHAALDRDPGTLRVGLATSREVCGFEMEAPCTDATVAAGRLLEDLGHHVEEVPLPYDEQAVLRTWTVLAATDTAAVVTRLEERYGVQKVHRSLEEIARVLAGIGRSLPAEHAGEARHASLGFGAALGEFFQTYNVVVMPTMGRAPIRLDEAEPTPRDERALRLLASPAGARLLRVGRAREAVIDAQCEQYTKQVMQRTMVANLAGTPAMSVPLHRTEDGLPIGVQFIGRFGDEATLLTLAAQLEAAKPWAIRS